MCASYRFFSPSGISESSRSRRCCSETDHACLYVSDLGFSFLAVGGSIGGVHFSVSERILAFAVVAGVRVGTGRRVRVVGRGECIFDWDGSADGREIKAPSVDAISTSALSSPISRRTCTPEARRVSPPLFRRRIRRSCSFSRAGSGASCCSPSDDESDERSNEASTGSMIDRRAFRTSCWAGDNALCCVGDGCDRA
jgi:hypothetical protein